MISKDNYELVKVAIQVHSRLKDRTYLILYKAAAKQSSQYMITPILEENFWHLVGCKIDDKIKLSPEQKHQLYSKCINGEDISEALVYTRQSQDVSKKVNVMNNVFDFVTNAKTIRICHTDKTPEASMFRVGAGSTKGVIGYNGEKKGMIPKTAQDKSIFDITKDSNNKIFLIISKPYGYEKYDRLDYAISNKIFPAIIDEIPDGVLYEEHLFDK